MTLALKMLLISTYMYLSAPLSHLLRGETGTMEPNKTTLIEEYKLFFAPCHGVLRFDCIMCSFISDFINRRYMAFHTTYPMQDSMLAGYKLWANKASNTDQRY